MKGLADTTASSVGGLRMSAASLVDTLHTQGKGGGGASVNNLGPSTFLRKIRKQHDDVTKSSEPSDVTGNKTLPSRTRHRHMERMLQQNDDDKDDDATVATSAGNSNIYEYPDECYDTFTAEEVDFGFRHNNSNLFIRQVKDRIEFKYPNATWIRRNMIYYNVYCVGLNTCFASLLPLLALLYFNTATLMALKKMIREHGRPNKEMQTTDLTDSYNSCCDAMARHGTGSRSNNHYCYRAAGRVNSNHINNESNNPSSSGAVAAVAQHHQQTVNQNIHHSSRAGANAAIVAGSSRVAGRNPHFQNAAVVGSSGVTGRNPHFQNAAIVAGSSGVAGRNPHFQNAAVAGSGVNGRNPHFQQLAIMHTSDTDQRSWLCRKLGIGHTSRIGLYGYRTSSSGYEPANAAPRNQQKTYQHQQRSWQATNGQNQLAAAAGVAAADDSGQERRDSFLQSYENLLKKKESRLTRISISIVWLFIFCHIWKLIPTVYELVYSENGMEMSEWPQWLMTIKHLSHTLITFNSAVNFLIYAML